MYMHCSNVVTHASTFGLFPRLWRCANLSCWFCKVCSWLARQIAYKGKGIFNCNSFELTKDCPCSKPLLMCAVTQMQLRECSMSKLLPLLDAQSNGLWLNLCTSQILADVQANCQSPVGFQLVANCQLTCWLTHWLVSDSSPSLTCYGFSMTSFEKRENWPLEGRHWFTHRLTNE